MLLPDSAAGSSIGNLACVGVSKRASRVTEGSVMAKKFRTLWDKLPKAAKKRAESWVKRELKARKRKLRK
jgi:hypothetical protein